MSDVGRSLISDRPWWLSLDFVTWVLLIVGVPLELIGFLLWRWLS